VLLLLATVAGAGERFYGFSCRTWPDLSLHCESQGLDASKMKPRWTIRVDGRQVDRASGWSVTLYPVPGRKNEVSMQGYLGGHDLPLLTHGWGREP
jgi:hypothetical protein